MAKSSHVIETEGRRGTSVYNNIKMQNPFKVIDLETFFFVYNFGGNAFKVKVSFTSSSPACFLPYFKHSRVPLPSSSLAPPAGQDGAPTERAAAGEAEAGAPEGRGQQHGI